MKHHLFIAIFICINSINAQVEKYTTENISISKWIDGTLLKSEQTKTLVIIIAGSGPTDRDGNQNFTKNNSLKKLATKLSENGISTFRYDKRVVKQIKLGVIDKKIVFDDFVNDAKDVVNYFKSKKEFEKTYIIGHSQGSLVGMLASEKDITGFISLAGAGKNIGDLLIEQITKSAPQFKEAATKVITQLKKGTTTNEYPNALASIFNPEIQPFMINWMTHNPTEIIKNLNIPILILNGDKDLQVTENEARLLKDSNINTQLVIIENMNHVLVDIKGDDLENYKSYNESFREISSQLISEILNFIK